MPVEATLFMQTFHGRMACNRARRPMFRPWFTDAMGIFHFHLKAQVTGSFNKLVFDLWR
jgi:hypothetical protein